MLVSGLPPPCGTAFVGLPRSTINLALTAGLVGLPSSAVLPVLQGGRANRLATLSTLAGLAYIVKDFTSTSVAPHQYARGERDHSSVTRPTCARDFVTLGMGDNTEAFLCGALDSLDSTSSEGRIIGPACFKRPEFLPVERDRYFNKAMSTCVPRDAPRTDIILASSSEGDLGSSGGAASYWGEANYLGYNEVIDNSGDGSGGNASPPNDTPPESANVEGNTFDRLSSLFLANGGSPPPPPPPPSSTTEGVDDDDKDQVTYILKWITGVLLLAAFAGDAYKNWGPTPPPVPMANVQALSSEAASSIGGNAQHSAKSTQPSSTVDGHNVGPSCETFYLLPGLLGSEVALARRAPCGTPEFSRYPPLAIPLNDGFGEGTFFYEDLRHPVQFRPLSEDDPVCMNSRNSSRPDLINYVRYGDDVPLHFSSGPDPRQAAKPAELRVSRPAKPVERRISPPAPEAAPPVFKHLNPHWTLTYTKDYFVWLVLVLFLGVFSLLLQCAYYLNCVLWMVEAPAAATAGPIVPVEIATDLTVDAGPPPETLQEELGILPEPDASFNDAMSSVDVVGEAVTEHMLEVVDAGISTDDGSGLCIAGNTVSPMFELVEGVSSENVAVDVSKNEELEPDLLTISDDVIVPTLEPIGEEDSTEDTDEDDSIEIFVYVSKDSESTIVTPHKNIVLAVEPLVRAPTMMEVLKDAAPSDSVVVDSKVVAPSELEAEVLDKGKGKGEDVAEVGSKTTDDDSASTPITPSRLNPTAAHFVPRGAPSCEPRKSHAIPIVAPKKRCRSHRKKFNNNRIPNENY